MSTGTIHLVTTATEHLTIFNVLTPTALLSGRAALLSPYRWGTAAQRGKVTDLRCLTEQGIEPVALESHGNSLPLN